jgi:hypothetical protein
MPVKLAKPDALPVRGPAGVPGTERLGSGIAGSDATLSARLPPADAREGEVRLEWIGDICCWCKPADAVGAINDPESAPEAGFPGDLGGPENWGHSEVLRPLDAADLEAKR